MVNSVIFVEIVRNRLFEIRERFSNQLKNTFQFGKQYIHCRLKSIPYESVLENVISRFIWLLPGDIKSLMPFKI